MVTGSRAWRGRDAGAASVNGRGCGPRLDRDAGGKPTTDEGPAFARYLDQPAIRFYERHGMSVESQWPTRVKIPGLKPYRMVKTLR